MSKDSYWFSHDSNAGRDIKLLKIQHIHSHWGKGVFWDVIEVLREQKDYKYPIDDSSLQILCGAIYCQDFTRFKNWFTDCVKVELFEIKDDLFFSNSLIRRMKKWEKQKKNGSKPKRSRIEAKAKPNRSIIEEDIIEEKSKEDNITREVIGFLNLTCKTDYRFEAKKNTTPIFARIREGFSLDQFKSVIVCKNREWSASEKYRKYLRPETLFGPKFEGYWNQARMEGVGTEPADPLTDNERKRQEFLKSL